MTGEEFEMIRLAIKSAYPNANIIPDKYAMKMWYKLLGDLDFKVAENALWEHMSISAFPPSIADIRRLCADRCERPVLSFEDAWGTVQKAMGMYGSEQPQKAFAAMDELTISVVKSLGWTRLCRSESPVADRANFREAYEAKAKALRKSRQLPEFVARDKKMLQEKHKVLEEKPVLQIKSEKVSCEDEPVLTMEQSEKRIGWFWKAMGKKADGKSEAE